MKRIHYSLVGALIAMALSTGCAYRTDSNIPSDAPESAAISTGSNPAVSAAQKIDRAPDSSDIASADLFGIDLPRQVDLDR